MMKRQQLRQQRPVAPQREQIEPETHSETHAEPVGHVHPNYRHWTWFRPSNW